MTAARAKSVRHRTQRRHSGDIATPGSGSISSIARPRRRCKPWPTADAPLLRWRDQGRGTTMASFTRLPRDTPKDGHAHPRPALVARRDGPIRGTPIAAAALVAAGLSRAERAGLGHAAGRGGGVRIAGELSASRREVGVAGRTATHGHGGAGQEAVALQSASRRRRPRSMPGAVARGPRFDAVRRHRSFVVNPLEN